MCLKALVNESSVAYFNDRRQGLRFGLRSNLKVKNVPKFSLDQEHGWVTFELSVYSQKKLNLGIN